jgi:hypothetical protein
VNPESRLARVLVYGAEAFSDLMQLAAMYSPDAPPTLKVYLAYFAASSGNVNEINVAVQNLGETSAFLEYIRMSEEPLPNFYSCTLTVICRFNPRRTVAIDPGQSKSIMICQNCLADNISTFSYPFNNNKNNLIHVEAVLSMLIDWGYETRWTFLPFRYTIPRR